MLAALALVCASETVHAADLPAGFVRLSDIDPSIRQDIRYAGSDNFLGRPVAGYGAPRCILTRQAAEALAAVQAALKAEGRTLVVFDCYRPRRAVLDMLSWARQGTAADPQWHPGVRRDRLVAEGYIAGRSAHSRGSTVDLAIAPLDEKGAAPDPACGTRGARTLDFGTGFDCFAPESATASQAVPPAARRNRRDLTALMKKAGFRNYAREWWHFGLVGEPFRKAFDFPVE
ncbi:MAG: M15 family metallopeptidase [Rhizobiales bacterium]|nr:M15 family metallopeptidase [Hyphomicrobiales bacterium]